MIEYNIISTLLFTRATSKEQQILASRSSFFFNIGVLSPPQPGYTTSRLVNRNTAEIDKKTKNR